MITFNDFMDELTTMVDRLDSIVREHMMESPDAARMALDDMERSGTNVSELRKMLAEEEAKAEKERAEEKTAVCPICGAETSDYAIVAFDRNFDRVSIGEQICSKIAHHHRVIGCPNCVKIVGVDSGIVSKRGK